VSRPPLSPWAEIPFFPLLFGLAFSSAI
jgi:hypothetical protein